MKILYSYVNTGVSLCMLYDVRNITVAGKQVSGSLLGTINAITGTFFWKIIVVLLCYYLNWRYIDFLTRIYLDYCIENT